MKVTIVVTTYNYGPYIARALRSALAQDIDPHLYEVLVVDDGSTDATPSILQQFVDSVRIVRQENRGLVAACNRGIQAAQGEYLIRLDADDEMDPDLIGLCCQILDCHPEVGLVYTDRFEVEVAQGARRLKKVGMDNIYDLIAPGIMFRRKNLIDVGLYDDLYWEEHDLMIRYLQQHVPYYLSQPLYVYYLHGNNMTHSAERRRQGWGKLIQKWGMDELRRWGQCVEVEQVYIQMVSRARKEQCKSWL